MAITVFEVELATEVEEGGVEVEEGYAMEIELQPSPGAYQSLLATPTVSSITPVRPPAETPVHPTLEEGEVEEEEIGRASCRERV